MPNFSDNNELLDLDNDLQNEKVQQALRVFNAIKTMDIKMDDEDNWA